MSQAGRGDSRRNSPQIRSLRCRNGNGFISEASLDDSFDAVLGAIEKLESDRYFRSTAPFAEPQLGRRGLYDLPLEGEELQRVRLALLWVLNLSDGNWSIEDIARRADMPLDAIVTAAEALQGAGILESA